jgi:hypothetical protein
VKPFSYLYEGQSHNALTDHYLIDGYKYYRIVMGDKSCIIGPSEIPDEKGQIIWVQKINAGDLIEDSELIQSLGEGLHNAEAI